MLSLHPQTGLIGPSPHDFLSVRGKDRAEFLHHLLSNDIKGLIPGQGRLACLLDRQGKIQFPCQVHMLDDQILLEMAPEDAGRAKPILERYRVSEAVSFEDQSKVIQAQLPSAAIDPEQAQISRIEAGIPWAPNELNDTVILNELGINENGPAEKIWVSFRKGCYVGQEIVTRIHHRAHPPRLLAGFLVEGTQVPEEQTPLLLEDKPVGELTSCCFSPRYKQPIALGFVQHGCQTERFRLRIGNQRVKARRVSLPFAGKP